MTVLSFFAITPVTYSQDGTNHQELQRLSAEWQKISLENKAQAEIFARMNNLPLKEEYADGTIMELQFIEGGVPFYYRTDNVNAALTTRTNHLHPGGSLGLNLDGTGYTGLGEWDGGAVRTTHQEFTNGGSSRVTQMDGNSTISAHATHVAGTMIAGGVSASAKGMGYNGTLKAWEWNSDVSEMAAAAANGLQISNHSYGYVRGWNISGSTWVWYGNPNISVQEDYLFGFYNSTSQQWDQIAYNAPYYLIVKSAGNDRLQGPVGAEHPQDGAPDGYDCIGEVGVAKNILTVGAVEDVPSYTGPGSVYMSSFSSWGPADDGRIKPDIVANGVSVYSCTSTSNSSYANYSGTSMASPNAAGSLALLQKHYQDTHGGASMRASTLKALIIHTADEAGLDPGPDYIYGWGLLNAAASAQKISEDASDGMNVIDELTLNNGGTYQQQVTCDGSQPLLVTVCWTDPPGTPATASLDPITPMLVNDLDLRITGNGNTYYPWKLNRDNPVAAATNSGENNVDNVEKIFVASPAAGSYTITIDHDGTLASAQVFSIIISGTGASAPQPPVADFTASSTQILAGQSVTFTDLSTNGPISWSWTFNGGTPASSNAQNPVVTYNTAGTYSVSLTAANAQGSDTETKTNYITVSDPPPPSYCTSHGNATIEWIGSVKIGGTTYTSGSSGAAGYQDFTGSVFNLQAGSTYSSTFTPAFSGASKAECWRVWIDFNHDYDFADAGELVFLANKKKTAISGNITIPAGALLGVTRMRVSMKRNSASVPCEVFASGEVEDYTINITASVRGTEAEAPAVVMLGDETPEEIRLYPNPVAGMLTVRIEESWLGAKVSLIDLAGRIISEQIMHETILQVGTAEFSPGIYFLVFQKNGRLVQKKFIKQ